MGWSAFLWTNLWWLFGIGALALGFLAFLGIRKLIKKHQAKKQGGASRSSSKSKKHEKSKNKQKDKVKQNDNDEQKNKQNDNDEQKNKQNNNDEQKKPHVKPRYANNEQNNLSNENKQEELSSRFALPRFDICDTKILEKDLEKFKKHQNLAIKASLTEQEQNELSELESYFKKTYHRIPNQSIPADYTQKESGYYCFNGHESSNFKLACQNTPYNEKDDDGKRIVIQVDCGDNRHKLSFCVNPNKTDILNAAMKDIDSTVSKLQIDPIVHIVSVNDGKFKVQPSMTYSAFCKQNSNKVSKQTAPSKSIELNQ